MILVFTLHRQSLVFSTSLPDRRPLDRMMRRFQRRNSPLVLAAIFEGKVVGDFQLTITSPEHGQGEVGFSFNPRYGGRGLATRALAAVLGFGFVQLGLHRITAATFVENERAWRLMERVGMRREAHFIHDGFVRGRWVDVFGYAILADEWGRHHPDLAAVVSLEGRSS